MNKHKHVLSNTQLLCGDRKATSEKGQYERPIAGQVWNLFRNVAMC